MTRLARLSGDGPMRAMLRRMAYATLAAVLLAWIWQGRHGAVSALLGGTINLVSGALFAWIVARGRGRTAGEILRTAIRAEVSKLALIFCLLWVVLVHYRQVVPAAFFGTFILTLVIFSTAILVRER